MQTQVKHISPTTLCPVSGISHISLSDNLVFISGQVPLDAQGQLIGANDIGQQTHQVFINLQNALAAVGADFGHVTKLNYFLRDISSAAVAQVKQIRTQYLTNNALPASTIIGVTGLASDDFLIEIEAYAVIPK